MILSTIHDFTELLKVTWCPEEFGRGDSMLSDINGAIDFAALEVGSGSRGARWAIIFQSSQSHSQLVAQVSPCHRRIASGKIGSALLFAAISRLLSTFGS